MELIHSYGFGGTLNTKSDRILRDLDLLKAINDKTKCMVQMTLTTYDEELCRKLELGVCTTRARFEALKVLRDAGIPTVVWLCPILPFINDTPKNINGILDYCEEAQVKGIICFGMGVTLRAGNREYFYRQLDCYFPGLKAEYIRRYGDAYMLDSPHSRELIGLLHRRCQSAGILYDNDRIFQYLSQFEEKSTPQMSLF